MHYLTKHYFDELISHGHHILYSAPVWKSGTKPPSWGLTSLSFQIYSEHDYTRETAEISNAVLILLGMTSFRKHPTQDLPYSAQWGVGAIGSCAGTVCLSRRVFFEDRLLKSLADVNGTTTVVPNFCPNSASTTAAIYTGDEDSEWGLALATWVERSCAHKRTVKPDWKLNTDKSESDYKWQFKNKWSFEHDDFNDVSRNGTYKVSCMTKNLLSFPESHNGTLDIVLRGDVQVELEFQGKESWSTHLQSTWASTLSIKTLFPGNGLSIEVTGDTQPHFQTVPPNVSIEKLFDVKALQGLLHVELSSLASELRQSFGGVWEHCFAGMGGLALSHPLFNKHGDIVFDMLNYIPRTQAVPLPQIPRSPIEHKRSFLSRAVDFIGDVLDDGKINHSNRKHEKTPSLVHNSSPTSTTKKVESPTAVAAPQHPSSPKVATHANGNGTNGVASPKH